MSCVQNKIINLSFILNMNKFKASFKYEILAIFYGLFLLRSALNQQLSTCLLFQIEILKDLEAVADNLT